MNYTTLKIIGRDTKFFHPNECPLCHKVAIFNNHQYMNYIDVNEKVEVVWKCPNNECQKIFIAYYSIINDSETQLVYFTPTEIILNEFPELIEKISPNFISIFKEAEKAKQGNLLQIAGPGYRKATEYLIKDYAKYLFSVANSEEENENKSESTDPKKEENAHNKEIEECFVGKVVEKYIDHPKVQAIAKITLWIGNDETHYLRIWKDKDITDLIILIKLLVDWIEIEYLSNQYETDMMPEKK